MRAAPSSKPELEGQLLGPLLVRWHFTVTQTKLPSAELKEKLVAFTPIGFVTNYVRNSKVTTPSDFRCKLPPPMR
ncbi:MAG: hypothetical protein ACI9W2_001612 [Gammaproteobacteria bacterium]|jgi:hypothetical protein